MEARSVGIVGVGMIGGSIALAALRAGYRVLSIRLFGLRKVGWVEVSASRQLWPILQSSLCEQSADYSSNSDCCAREDWCGAWESW